MLSVGASSASRHRGIYGSGQAPFTLLDLAKLGLALASLAQSQGNSRVCGCGSPRSRAVNLTLSNRHGLRLNRHCLDYKQPSKYPSRYLIAIRRYLPSWHDGCASFNPDVGCAQRGNRTSTPPPDGRQTLTSQLFTFAASCCGAATCSAVFGACGKCGNRSVEGPHLPISTS